MQDFLESLQTADMILLGLGEEFDNLRSIRGAEDYEDGVEKLTRAGQGFLIPAWQRIFREAVPEETERIEAALHKLASLLEGKNYFVASVSTNAVIARIPWREGRLVMPCGSDIRCQCSPECGENLRILGEGERADLRRRLQQWKERRCPDNPEEMRGIMGRCAGCGGELSLNNIYNNRYDEGGYLPDWENYMKWLQGTLHRKIVVLELGVGMKFPSVIRFPFEKVAYLNQNARFYRVHEKLYQMTGELAEKGTGIAKNAIDWLQDL